MNAKAIFLFSIGLTFVGFSQLSGQSSEDLLYNDLASAQLVVRLPSQEKKMAAMEASLSDPEISASTRQTLRTRLDRVRVETSEYHQAIVKAFRAYFDALPVRFVYDTTRNAREAAFVDDRMEDHDPPPLAGSIIQLRFGRPLADAGNRPESMVLTDENLQDLGPPFPKPLIMTGISYGINKLLAPGIALEKLLEKRVKKLDRQLEGMMR